jgi:hypothetical protein
MDDFGGILWFLETGSQIPYFGQPAYDQPAAGRPSQSGVLYPVRAVQQGALLLEKHLNCWTKETSNFLCK